MDRDHLDADAKVRQLDLHLTGKLVELLLGPAADVVRIIRDQRPAGPNCHPAALGVSRQASRKFFDAASNAAGNTSSCTIFCSL